MRRVDAPFPDLLALTLAGHDVRGALLIGLAQGARGVGLVEQRPGGSGQSPFLLRARKLLERGRVVALEANDTRMSIAVQRAELRCTLVIELHGALGNARLLGGAGELIAALHPNAPALPAAPMSAVAFPDLATLRAEGAKLLGSRGDLAMEDRKAQVARSLRGAERKLARRLAAVEADRARAERSATLRGKASLLLANLHALPREAAAAFELLDYEPRSTRTRNGRGRSEARAAAAGRRLVPQGAQAGARRGAGRDARGADARGDRRGRARSPSSCAGRRQRRGDRGGRANRRERLGIDARFGGAGAARARAGPSRAFRTGGSRAAASERSWSAAARTTTTG